MPHIVELPAKQRAARFFVVFALVAHTLGIFAFAAVPLTDSPESQGIIPIEAVVMVLAAISLFMLLTRLIKKKVMFEEYAYLVQSLTSFFTFMGFLIASTQFDAGPRFVFAMFLLAGLLGGAGSYLSDVDPHADTIELAE